MESHTEKAYAKVNLFLDILGKRDDGYHDIYTIMQLVTLYDEVEITLTHNDDINLTVKNADLGIPKEKNLAYIAAKAFYENLNKTLLRVSSRADITITKNIPAAAGLAGGVKNFFTCEGNSSTENYTNASRNIFKFHPWYSINWHFVPFYCRTVFHYVYIKPISCPGESGMQLQSH